MGRPDENIIDQPAMDFVDLAVVDFVDLFIVDLVDPSAQSQTNLNLVNLPTVDLARSGCH